MRRWGITQEGVLASDLKCRPIIFFSTNDPHTDCFSDVPYFTKNSSYVELFYVEYVDIRYNTSVIVLPTDHLFDNQFETYSLAL